MAAEPVGWWGDDGPKWEIVHVGTEPVVVHEQGTDGNPLVAIMCSGWKFRDGDRIVQLEDGATIELALVCEESELPVPIEDGFVKVAGFTVGELRGIARLAR
jgi:hypothetical protein